MINNILIVDSSEQYLSELKTIINKKLLNCQVYTAKDLFEMLSAVKKNKLHVLVFDANILIDEDIQALHVAHKLLMGVKLIALFDSQNSQHVKHFITMGIDGYVIKNKSMEQITKAIEAAMHNMCCFEQKLLTQFLEQTHATIVEETKKLTAVQLGEKETKIMQMIVFEYTNCELANRLFMGKKTFENMLRALCLKFKVKNKVGLAVVAGKLALLKGSS